MGEQRFMKLINALEPTKHLGQQGCHQQHPQEQHPRGAPLDSAERLRHLLARREFWAIGSTRGAGARRQGYTCSYASRIFWIRFQNILVYVCCPYNASLAGAAACLPCPQHPRLPRAEMRVLF